MMTFMTILQRYFEILAGSVPQAAKKAIICAADGYEECSPRRPNTRRRRTLSRVVAGLDPATHADIWVRIGLGPPQR
jgi:hypothetical protein